MKKLNSQDFWSLFHSNIMKEQIETLHTIKIVRIKLSTELYFAINDTVRANIGGLIKDGVGRNMKYKQDTIF